jgi:hypothetical protein
MTDLQWFAFVVLPVRVTVFGALLAAAGVGLINRADRRSGALAILAAQRWGGAWLRTPADRLEAEERYGKRQADLFGREHPPAPS